MYMCECANAYVSLKITKDENSIFFVVFKLDYILKGFGNISGILLQDVLFSLIWSFLSQINWLNWTIKCLAADEMLIF